MDARRRASDETPTPKVADKEPIWFPTKLSDLDRFKKVFQCGVELEADHPGFQDPVYRERRQKLAQISNNFSLGEKIPRVDYNDVENNTWGVIYRSLKQMHPTHACREYRENFEVFESCVNGFNDKQIPQLEDISEFLFRRTGWRLRPTAGLLAPREFLAGLAFRIFHTTQYIRHSSKPFFTPEPDICHEILGHIPLLADQNFADFSQEIGLASLGASDQDLEKLANCYWFTVEFGLCEEEGQIRAYGAGLLSSFGELQYSLTDQPEKKKFEPEEASITEHPTSAYNPLYFVAESFESAKEKVQKFSTTFGRSFQVHYNPSSQNIEVTTCT